MDGRHILLKCFIQHFSWIVNFFLVVARFAWGVVCFVDAYNYQCLQTHITNDKNYLNDDVSFPSQNMFHLQTNCVFKNFIKMM